MAERRSIARTAGPEPRRSFGGRVRVSTLEVQDFRSEVRLFDERLEVSLGTCVVCRAGFTGTSDATRIKAARSMTADDEAQEGDRKVRASDPSEHRVPRTTTTGDPEKDYRQKDDGANSEFREHGRRGPYNTDSDDDAWDPPEADDDA